MSGTWFEARRLMAVAAVAGLVWGAAACGDDGPSGPDTVDLDVVAGLYDPISYTFDPQGAAPAGDVLEALSAEEYDIELNISQTERFQIVYRDPVSGIIETLEGDVESRVDAVGLTFDSQAEADQFLFPRTIELEWNVDEQSLGFSGLTAVSRPRLQQLFPELYGDEPWTTPTIPGTLNVRFER